VKELWRDSLSHSLSRTRKRLPRQHVVRSLYF